VLDRQRGQAAYATPAPGCQVLVMGCMVVFDKSYSFLTYDKKARSTTAPSTTWPQ
jgi:hypothetical protein